MNIPLKWGEYGYRVSPDEKKLAQDGINATLPDVLIQLKTPPNPTDVMVYLFPDITGCFFNGVVTTADGEEIIKITGSLGLNGTRSYSFS